jgi:predicted phage-related endonuclease
MRYILSENQQGTPEWKSDRAGKATGSRASDIVAKIKTGEAAARRDYRVQLVTERLTGAPAEDVFVNDAMRWGTETEPFARMAYESKMGLMVREAGFTYLPYIQVGCSVDGFIEGGGLLECKCPKSATHIKYLQANKLPSEYEPQILHNLFVTGEPFADFVSFDPRLPENLQLFHVRVMRDEAAMKAYEAELFAFLASVDALESELRKWGQPTELKIAA